jgi:hypothetical protein
MVGDLCLLFCGRYDSERRDRIVGLLNRREIPPLREPTPSQERRRRKSIGSLRSE